MTIPELRKKAKWVRLQVLGMAQKSGKAHIGGTYSATDLLVALYYGRVLKFKVDDHTWENRDRFILSKGHACSALYAIFLDLGIISEKLYDSYGENGGLGGQLEVNIPGVDFNTGSIGHSVGVAAGMAQAAKMNSQKFRAITLVGDSEFYEGSIWESVIFASEHKLNNLIVIIDRNRLMVTDVIDDEGLYKDFVSKINFFGWDYFEIDGHNFEKIIDTFKKIRSAKKPVLILANTVKGRGVSFMENNVEWHNRALTREEFEKAKGELEAG